MLGKKEKLQADRRRGKNTSGIKKTTKEGQILGTGLGKTGKKTL